MVVRLLFSVEAAVPPQNNLLIKKLTAPHTDRYERRLFPPEQSLANDKIDRPAIYLYKNEATKFRDQPSRFTIVTAFCFAPLTTL
jgi:hypothetical protein